MGGVAAGLQPSGPVGLFVGGEVEGLAPAVQVELDGGFVAFVGDGEQGLVGGVGFGAGEIVQMGLFFELGGNGVAFDVEESFAVLGLRFDEFGVEMVVPEVALGVLVEGVHVAGVLGLEALHEARNGAFSQGFEQEMDVVGHEAKGVDADFVAAGEEVESVEVKDGVGGAEEGFVALGSALVDVIDLAAFPVAEAGWVRLGSHVI